MNIKQKNSGFTLIELVVAIGILSVLAIAAIVALNPLAQFQKANDARRKSDLAQVQRALESYYEDNKSYPVACGSFQIQTLGGSCITWGNAWTPYMNALPKDPTTGVKYAYVPTANLQSYYIYASLDRGSADPGVCNGGGWCNSISAGNKSQNPCGISRTCNYGVSSPDVTP